MFLHLASRALGMTIFSIEDEYCVAILFYLPLNKNISLILLPKLEDQKGKSIHQIITAKRIPKRHSSGTKSNPTYAHRLWASHYQLSLQTATLLFISVYCLLSYGGEICTRRYNCDSRCRWLRGAGQSG